METNTLEKSHHKDLRKTLPCCPYSGDTKNFSRWSRKQSPLSQGRLLSFAATSVLSPSSKNHVRTSLVKLAHIFFVHSLVVGHLPWFHSLAVVKHASVNIDLQVSLKYIAWSAFDKYLGDILPLPQVFSQILVLLERICTYNHGSLLVDFGKLSGVGLAQSAGVL